MPSVSLPRQYIQDQKITRVGQAILDHERMRFGLTLGAANVIDNALLMAKLEQLCQIFIEFKAE